jgi:hypothetical protein
MVLGAVVALVGGIGAGSAYEARERASRKCVAPEETALAGQAVVQVALLFRSRLRYFAFRSTCHQVSAQQFQSLIKGQEGRDSYVLSHKALAVNRL